MSGNKAVLDSDVIILASKGMIDIDRVVATFDSLYVSIISYMEIYGFEFENPLEKQMIDGLFGDLEIIEVDFSVADIAIDYRKNKIKKIKLPDAVVLATARLLNVNLLTNNYKDFVKIDPTVSLVDLDEFKLITN